MVWNKEELKYIDRKREKEEKDFVIFIHDI